MLSGVGLYGGFAGGETELEQRDPVVHQTILSGDLNDDDQVESSDSSCCLAQSEPGCNDLECESAVCGADPFCCKQVWDLTCARRTVCVCGDLCSVQCDNSFHVVVGSGMDATVVLNGFVITSGNANGETARTTRGGGILIEDGDTTVVNCVVFNNRADAEGGGMYHRGSATIVNVLFAGNAASWGGGVFHADGNASFTNCIFTGNTTDDAGGGMANSGSSPTITNCSFSGNNGGGIQNRFGAAPIVTNSIFWRNVANDMQDESAQISSDPSSRAEVNYTDVQGLMGALGGTGNIGEDPMFVDALGLDHEGGTPDDDLRLSAGSPCIDAGSNLAVPEDIADLDADGDRTEQTPVDIDRTGRFFDDPQSPNTGEGAPPIVDMGAFEVPSDCNDNDVFDDEDVANKTSDDCNGNNVPDECEIREDSPASGGPFFCTLDCNRDCDDNGQPDDCY